MKNTFSHLLREDPGFDEIAIRDALVVLDANVLLDFYRRTPENRATRFAVLDAVGDRLRVPHQVGLEFHRNRTTVAKALKESYDEARGAVDAMEKILKNFGRSHYQDTRNEVSAVGADAAKSLREKLAEIEGRDAHAQDLDDEHLLGRIEVALAGRMMKAPTARKIQKRVERFMTYRLPNQIPPGYKDGTKRPDLAAAGDYLVWCEILTLAREEGRPVLFVSDDVKEDWRQKGSSGHPDQPRPELLAEFAERSAAIYHQMTWKDFLKKAGPLLGVPVSEGVMTEENSALEAILATERARAERGRRSAIGPGVAGVQAWLDIVAREDRNMASLLGSSIIDRINELVPPFELGDGIPLGASVGDFPRNLDLGVPSPTGELMCHSLDRDEPDGQDLAVDRDADEPEVETVECAEEGPDEKL